MSDINETIDEIKKKDNIKENVLLLWKVKLKYHEGKLVWYVNHRTGNGGKNLKMIKFAFAAVT